MLACCCALLQYSEYFLACCYGVLSGFFYVCHYELLWCSDFFFFLLCRCVAMVDSMVFCMLLCNSYGLLSVFEHDSIWFHIGLGIGLDFYGKSYEKCLSLGKYNVV